MRRRLRHHAAAVSLALAAATTIAAGQSAAPDAAAVVRSLTHAVNAAYAANDLEQYFSYYAPELTQWWPSGRVDLPTYRESWTRFVKGGGRVELAEVSDLQVQVGPDGRTAVATYALHVRTRSAKGDVSDDRYQETDVWFQRGGKWQIVHLHYSPAEPR